VSVTGSTAAVEVAVHDAVADDAASAVASVHTTLLRDYPGLVDVLRRRAGSEPLARDLLQDAIVTTLAKLSEGVPMPPDVLAGYVFRTAMNHLRNHRRRERACVTDEAAVSSAIDETASPAEASQRDTTRRLVRRVLASLDSPRDREVLVRFYLDEQDKQQVCEALGLSAVHFDRVISRARERMKRGLERIGLRPWDLVADVIVVAACASFG
jgi:RNA polymerase sigma-70 factor (ECF subfamily)